MGVTDGSCNEILDAFDRALEEAGVRAAPPKRKYTGGVCELAAARDYVLRKVRRPPPAQVSQHLRRRRATRRGAPGSSTLDGRRSSADAQAAFADARIEKEERSDGRTRDTSGL
jgi:hypothetical protein